MNDKVRTSTNTEEGDTVAEFDMVEEFVPDNDTIVQNRNISCIFIIILLLVAVASSFETMDIKVKDGWKVFLFFYKLNIL